MPHTALLSLAYFGFPLDNSFFYKVKLEPLATIAKRTVLSQIARIFYLLGWIALIVKLEKMLMREFWISKKLSTRLKV